MKFARSLFALFALATVSACATGTPPAAPPAAPVVEASPAALVVAPSEDLSALPRAYTVYFDTNSTEIRASAMQVLWEAAQNASKLKPLTIRVTGFTDAGGSRSHNQTLSERRAAAVAAQFAKLGVTVAIDARGKGETGKRKDAKSRRVEISFETNTAARTAPITVASAPADQTVTAAAPDRAPALATAVAIGTAAPLAAPAPAFAPAAEAPRLADGPAARPMATGPPVLA